MRGSHIWIYHSVAFPSNASHINCADAGSAQGEANRCRPLHPLARSLVMELHIPPNEK